MPGLNVDISMTQAGGKPRAQTAIGAAGAGTSLSGRKAYGRMTVVPEALQQISGEMVDLKNAGIIGKASAKNGAVGSERADADRYALQLFETVTESEQALRGALGQDSVPENGALRRVVEEARGRLPASLHTAYDELMYPAAEGYLRGAKAARRHVYEQKVANTVQKRLKGLSEDMRTLAANGRKTDDVLLLNTVLAQKAEQAAQTVRTGGALLGQRSDAIESAVQQETTRLCTEAARILAFGPDTHASVASADAIGLERARSWLAHSSKLMAEGRSSGDVKKVMSGNEWPEGKQGKQPEQPSRTKLAERNEQGNAASADKARTGKYEGAFKPLLESLAAEFAQAERSIKARELATQMLEQGDAIDSTLPAAHAGSHAGRRRITGITAGKDSVAENMFGVSVDGAAGSETEIHNLARQMAADMWGQHKRQMAAERDVQAEVVWAAFNAAPDAASRRAVAAGSPAQMKEVLSQAADSVAEHGSLQTNWDTFYNTRLALTADTDIWALRHKLADTEFAVLQAERQALADGHEPAGRRRLMVAMDAAGVTAEQGRNQHPTGLGRQLHMLEEDMRQDGDVSYAQAARMGREFLTSVADARAGTEIIRGNSYGAVVSPFSEQQASKGGLNDESRSYMREASSATGALRVAAQTDANFAEPLTNSVDYRIGVSEPYVAQRPVDNYGIQSVLNSNSNSKAAYALSKKHAAGRDFLKGTFFG